MCHFVLFILCTGTTVKTYKKLDSIWFILRVYVNVIMHIHNNNNTYSYLTPSAIWTDEHVNLLEKMTTELRTKYDKGVCPRREY